jgi:hypothetical protein
MAALTALLGVFALTIRPRRPDLTRLHPGRLARGCVALALLLVALGLVGLAVLVAQR